MSHHSSFAKIRQRKKLERRGTLIVLHFAHGAHGAHTEAVSPLLPSSVVYAFLFHPSSVFIVVFGRFGRMSPMPERLIITFS